MWKPFRRLHPLVKFDPKIQALSQHDPSRLISAEEEAEAVNNLPAVEKSLYWLLSLMYGRSSPNRIAPMEEEEEDLSSGPRLQDSQDSEPLPGMKLPWFASERSEKKEANELSPSCSSSDSELTATTSESSHAPTEHAVTAPWPDSPYAVKSRKVPKGEG